MRNAQYDRGFADGYEGLAPREPGKLYFEGYFDGRKHKEEEDVD